MHRRATITFLLQSFGKNWYSGPHIYERQSAGDSEWWKTRTKVLEISYNNPVRKFRITYLKKSKPNWDLSGEKTKKGENITPNLGLPPPPHAPPSQIPVKSLPTLYEPKWDYCRIQGWPTVVHFIFLFYVLQSLFLSVRHRTPISKLFPLARATFLLMSLPHWLGNSLTVNSLLL